jgi:beta-lactamase superfamily II metal-dependent hydrolase
MTGVSLVHIDYWDVGQADCSVLHFADGGIILIDTGRMKNPLVDWLQDRPRTINSIILTHNDADHAGALCSLVGVHESRIGSIFMLLDRAKDDPKFQKLFRCARAAEKRGSFKIQTASADTVIWASPDDKTFLRIVHPTFSELIEASSPNAASALVVLEHSGKILAIWPGDLELKKIVRLTSCDNLDMLLGPHHGGPSDLKKNSVPLPTSLKPKRAFMSVGTFNLYGHPRPLYVKALGKRGCVVRCSELTVRCDADRVGLREPVFSGAGALGLRANSTGVPCRGSFRAYFNDGMLVPDEFETEHTERIFKLAKPLCLRGTASTAK